MASKYDNYYFYLNHNNGNMEIYDTNDRIVAEISECVGMPRKELYRLFEETIDTL